MAGILCIAQTAEVALSAATERTVMQIVAATSHRVKVLRWGVFFDGKKSGNEPVQVTLLRQSSAGTMTSLSPVNMGVGSETLQTTAQHSSTGTLPTAGDILDSCEVHPQSGYEVIFPIGQEIFVPGGGRLGINCNAVDAVNVRAKIIYEE
jgi:hypothetical protein